jgi:DNA-binding transcriptional LysR family regulator
MNLSLLQLELFYHVCLHKSFTKAANNLNFSKAHVSQQISKLERDVGLKLLHRTTRTLDLTTAGLVIFEHAKIIIAEKEDTNASLAALQKKAQGNLNITCPNAFAECFLAKALPQFMNAYPDITISLRLSSLLFDLEKEKIDVAIRLTHEPPLDFVAKHLGFYQLGIYTSPAYLSQNGAPKKIEELSQHACLICATVVNSQSWPFWIEDREIEIPINPVLQADNHHVILQAMLNGMGITRLPSYLVDDLIQKELVVPLFKSILPSPIPIYAIYPHTRLMPTKLRVFLSFLQNLLIEKK